MKVLGVIPARGGSKGIPNKNIKDLCGKPLLQYTSDAALQSQKLTKLILSSDSDHIIKVGSELGLEVPFKRPASLATDTASSLAVIRHALEFFMEQDVCFDAVCILQVTTPFRPANFIDDAIETFAKNDTDSLISVLPIPHEYNPHWAFKNDDNGLLHIATGEKEIISRRQDLPKAYHRDGSIYITKTNVLLEQNTLYGRTISYIESDADSYVNIDTMEDWRKAEALLKNQ